MLHDVLSHSFILSHQIISALLRWLTDHSLAFQALNALAMIALTIAIIGVTCWQSYLTNKALRVANQQFNLEWYPQLHAEFVATDHHDEARITNLGRSIALLFGLRLRPHSSEKIMYFGISDRSEERR